MVGGIICTAIGVFAAWAIVAYIDYYQDPRRRRRVPTLKGIGNILTAAWRAPSRLGHCPHCGSRAIERVPSRHIAWLQAIFKRKRYARCSECRTRWRIHQ